MQNIIVRIQKAEIKNIKNVEHGIIRFPCNMNHDIFQETSDILGIYGQNGSGKSAFISALNILKTLLSGRSISNEMEHYITAGKENACLKFELSMIYNESFYKVIYEVNLKKIGKNINKEHESRTIISHEKITYSVFYDNQWSKSLVLVHYQGENDDIFLPKSRVKEITSGQKEILEELRLAKRLSIKELTSFIFSQDARIQFEKVLGNMVFYQIIYGLYIFGSKNLCIFSSEQTGVINANLSLPFNIRIKSNDMNYIAVIPIQLDGTSTVSSKECKLIEDIIFHMNVVLRSIIPELSIEMKKLGTTLLENGETGEVVELVSKRGNTSIPLKYESDGIKKIISILNMLIAMYNNESMTLAVDELDSGVFEYLLGELLKIIQQSGKGQLIFTSHNLRPLEVLEKKSIIFTTTNPLNRYIRLKNVKTNHNLRDFYFHDIILGGQSELIYEETNSFAIASAFRQAGRVYEE